ncbi:MAG: two-component system, cell cycle sensor histidine kinase and response regulator CckA [Chthoniobacter sp.]|jgi:PAS domain S-box-containing protein|nr:two-component system, cell cycle sensor histidine kinase and response regulator CckA [Chthoniobacter sp.]
MTKVNILIVEDEALVAADLGDRLREMGYTVAAELSSGEETLERIASLQPDLILMDIVLDGEMDGIEAARQVRSRWDTPVVFLTAHADNNTLRRARVAEPFGYVIKPFAEAELHATVEMALYKHKADSQLRKMEQWLATTLRSIGDGVLTTDEQARVTFLNPMAERLTGWKLMDAAGRNSDEVLRLVHRQTGEPIADPARRAIAGGAAVTMPPETALRTRSGLEIPIDDSAAPIRDEDGRVRGAVVVFHDCSEQTRLEEERRHLEEKMREAQKLESLGLMAGGIAHDFNNLLTGIMGNAALCRMKLHRTNPLHENLQKIQTTGQRAADLCKQMLAYAGKGKTAHAAVEMSALVGETVRLVNLSVSKKVAVKLDLASGQPPVEGDPTQLQQVVMNLVINASEAIGEHPGEIRITTGIKKMERWEFASAVLSPELPEGDYLFVQVRDTGDGMAPETLSKIFDPFFTTKFTGRGLGLAATLGIVRAHHGALFVESAPGKGSTFRLLLPAPVREWKEIPAAPPEAEPARLRGSGKVLLVDDEEDVRSVTREMLELSGFEVVEACNGREALQACTERAEPFRLVLMDVTMPDMNGVEAFDELHRLYPRLPVLLMSGYSEQEAALRFGDASGSDFLQKPFLPSQLEKKLHRLLA